MIFDDHSETTYADEAFSESSDISATQHSESIESNNKPEMVINTLTSVISSYRNFQTELDNNKILIQTLQSEIEESKGQKEAITAKLAKMPTPDSLKEDNYDDSVFSDNTDSFSSDSQEHESDTYSYAQQNASDDATTDETSNIATNDQVIKAVTDNKSYLKTNTCMTIERYIESIKNSIDNNIEHSETYLEPLNLSCSLLTFQIKHIKLLERLVAVLGEQRSLKAKEKEMHDIVSLLAEQFGD